MRWGEYNWLSGVQNVIPTYCYRLNCLPSDSIDRRRSASITVGEHRSSSEFIDRCRYAEERRGCNIQSVMGVFTLWTSCHLLQYASKYTYFFLCLQFFFCKQPNLIEIINYKFFYFLNRFSVVIFCGVFLEPPYRQRTRDGKERAVVVKP